MTAREFFDNLYHLRREWGRAGDRLAEAEEMAEAARGARLDVCGGKFGGPRASSVELAAEIVEERRAELEKAKENFYEEWNRLHAVRHEFSDPLMFNMAIMRYHMGLPWDDVSKTLHYSRRTVMRLNRCIIQETAALIPGITA